MKTAELDGLLLNYWVAIAEGEKPYLDNPMQHEITSGEYFRWLKQGNYGSAKETPKYSSDWSQAGPIIERERINVAYVNDRYGIGWVAYMPTVHQGFGETPLIAAMRAFVASRFGDEVEDIQEQAN